MKHVKTALGQIDWQRLHEGDYYGNDPLLVIQKKLRVLRDGGENTLTNEDCKTLARITDRSIKKICNYDYGPNVDAEECRQFALQPLFDLKTELKDIGRMQ